jgi:hypothetical protein
MSKLSIKRGDIVQKKGESPELLTCFAEEWEVYKKEYRPIEVDTENLKEFKHKTKDEISFILQILHDTTNIQREDIQKLLKSNFSFDYNLFTFNAMLSDGSLVIIQPLKDESESLKIKTIITNKLRDIVSNDTCNSIEKCLEYIELYLIRNKPSLTFDYFKENIQKYKTEVEKTLPKEESDVTVVEENERGVILEPTKMGMSTDEFFDHISPAPMEDSKNMGQFESEESDSTEEDTDEFFDEVKS